MWLKSCVAFGFLGRLGDSPQLAGFFLSRSFSNIRLMMIPRSSIWGRREGPRFLRPSSLKIHEDSFKTFVSTLCLPICFSVGILFILSTTKCVSALPKEAFFILKTVQYPALFYWMLFQKTNSNLWCLLPKCCLALLALLFDVILIASSTFTVW